MLVFYLQPNKMYIENVQEQNYIETTTNNLMVYEIYGHLYNTLTIHSAHLQTPVGVSHRIAKVTFIM